MVPKDLCLILCLVILFKGDSNALKLNAGAYEDLVIQVGEEVPADRCRDVLLNLESTLSESSLYLFSALDGRAYVRSASILLPSSWPDQCAPSAVTASSGNPADITLITRGQPVWTQQSAGCGLPGDHIYLNYKNLQGGVDDVVPLARLFVKEFAKYRYGVFDEQGYAGDSVYPVCHPGEYDGTLKVTGCSDLPLKDDGMCNEEENQGHSNTSFLVDSKARTSIMFDPTAPSVSMFCDEGNHDRYAPTKHNFMCDKRSTLDVILQHPDFLTAVHGQPDGQITNTTPSISYRRRMLTRYVLVIEDTQEMLVRESWTYLRNAIRKWAVYDLPKNTEVALIMVNESAATVLLQPTPLLNHTSRDVVASNIPYTPGDTRAPACLHCAMKEAISILQESTSSRGPASSVIVLIASGTEHANEKVIEQARTASQSGIRITTVNYPGVLRQAPLDKLAEETGGLSFTVYERKHNIDTSLLTTYFQLTNVMYSIAVQYHEGANYEMPMEIHRRELTDDGRNSITGSFVLDEGMGEPARFQLFTHNVETPLIRTVSLWSPSQRKYQRRSDSLLGVKIITLAAAISEPGTWTYNIERWAGNPQPHYVQVMATPRASAAVVKAHARLSKVGSALVLRADVMRGLLPVLGARVEVQVTRPESNGSIAYKDKFELLDTGSGDPDVTKGDGIYTRYFSASNSGPGVYIFDIMVTDNGNTAYCAQEGPSEEPCCGSKTPTSKVEPLSPFQRVLPPLTVQITAEDILAAEQGEGGRIGDLRARILPQEQKARLTWTSPDMAGHNAVRYEVKYARSVQDISDKYETDAALWEQAQPFPLAAGSETTLTLDFTTPETMTLLDKPLYFAVKAFSQRGSHERSSKPSNWARVLVLRPPPPDPTILPTYSTVDYTAWPFPNSGSVSVDNVVPGVRDSGLGVQLVLPIVVGVVLLLLMVIVYCYFCVARKRGRELAKKTVSTSSKLQSAITIVPSSPTRNTSTPPPQQQQDAHLHAYSNDLHTVGVPLGYQFDDEPKKRYSIVQQQEQQLIEELKQQQQQQQHYGGLNVSVISGGETLQRVGRTLSPYESWTATQLLHEHERRHSPMDELMAQQQQHLDQHYNVMVPPPVPPLPTYNGYPPNYSIYGVHPQSGVTMYHQPPPPFNVSLQGSVSSVNSADKKKRNVTMV